MTRKPLVGWLFVSTMGLITNHLLAYVNGPTALNTIALACFTVGSSIWLYLLWTGDDE